MLLTELHDGNHFFYKLNGSLHLGYMIGSQTFRKCSHVLSLMCRKCGAQPRLKIWGKTCPPHWKYRLISASDGYGYRKVCILDRFDRLIIYLMFYTKGYIYIILIVL